MTELPPSRPFQDPLPWAQASQVPAAPSQQGPPQGRSPPVPSEPRTPTPHLTLTRHLGPAPASTLPVLLLSPKRGNLQFPRHSDPCKGQGPPEGIPVGLLLLNARVQLGSGLQGADTSREKESRLFQ